jgi:cysteine desulfurase / selenocysteine lyase
MTNWQAIRNEFPVCKDYVYLNPAGGSPLSKTAAAEGKRYYDEMLEKGDIYWDEWLVRTESVRKKVAELIGATPEEIGFMPNTSSGMAHIASMLYKKGKVLSMNDEFPSSTVPWINLGAKLELIQPENYCYPIDLIEKHLTPDVKAIVTSYVQYRTGFRQDLQALGEFCKQKGLYFVVNATQAFGVFPIDVKKYKIDFLVFSGLKWAGAGYGSGVIYINKNILEKESFPMAGWRSPANPEKVENFTFSLRKESSVLEAGSPNFPPIFTLGGAIDLIQRIGIDEVQERVLGLNRYFRKRLKEENLPYVELPEKNCSGITIVKTSEPKRIQNELMKQKIYIGARGEGVRISMNFFNNEEDLEVFIKTFKVVI